MLFNSFEFAVYFFLVYGMYIALPFKRQNTLLLLAGYVFYGWWDVRFLFLIAFSTSVDFWIGLVLAEGRIPNRQRMTASVFLPTAAMACLGVNWQEVFKGNIQNALAAGDQVLYWALASTAAVVLLANLSHGYVARMSAERRRGVMIFTTVFVNLTFLGIFKYFNFFIDSANAAITSLGWQAALLHLHIVLPVGISFYTFQSLSYTIDVSRGLVTPVRRLQDFALFVAYFPPMVAGPIERAKNLLPQLMRPRRINLRQISHGLLLIIFGLFKKIAIADGVAPAVNAVFNSTGAVSASDIGLATLLFAIQIFCDFSGYSDVARGISKLLGIELMVNFNLPYFSKNPSEFWRRWHISLSSWLRDYLYIGLGGNRHGEKRTYANLMATMTLGGLWHGAAWNFVLWGIYQGALLCVHRYASPRSNLSFIPARLKSSSLSQALQIAFFFVFICYGWLLFRANSLDQIILFTQTLLGSGAQTLPSVLPRPPLSAMLGITLLAGLQVAEYHQGRTDVIRHAPPVLQGAVYAAAIFILIMGTSNAPVQFIYFQF